MTNSLLGRYAGGISDACPISALLLLLEGASGTETEDAGACDEGERSEGGVEVAST